MATHVQVRIESGILEGYVTENKEDSGKEYYSFQGIPYARPPIGELRFKAPERVQPWEGVREATKDGDQCFSRFFNQIHEKAGSEDCLTLNVFTPKLPVQAEDGTECHLLPVMVFIHGGSFTYGSNSKIKQNPEYLIRDDVVIVVINYRIGLLGFLSLDDPSLDVPGNAGFKDMVMALKWVNENIKVFNGDPNNVTIFGQSAGAASVHLLMLSSAAEEELNNKDIVAMYSSLDTQEEEDCETRLQ
ncbi:hypothetical protein WA026_007875 [Henosepilachna vigintioctopunctata]|uniref:Carboxylesterase type B domain-containing protein n=1 Tax=Henosepilachna vigintioctopunctata TaxID=420089 RepID=A0AAW1U496_9CUCU